jgi:hypothetical protein
MDPAIGPASPGPVDLDQLETAGRGRDPRQSKERRRSGELVLLALQAS